MPHEQENNEATTDQRAQLANMLGKNDLSDAEYQKLSIPGVKEIIDSHVDDPDFINELRTILGDATAAGKTERVPRNLDARSKLAKRIGAGVLVFAAAVGVGAAAEQGYEALKNDSGSSVSLADYNIPMPDQSSPEKAAEFFNLTPSTAEFPGTVVNNFGPRSETFFNYDGSEASKKALLDEFSDMFRRDAHIMAVWATVLREGDAPYMPTLTDLQNSQMRADFEAKLNVYAADLLKPENLQKRTDLYHTMMDDLDRATISDVQQYNTDHIGFYKRQSTKPEGVKESDAGLDMDVEGHADSAKYRTLTVTNSKQQEIKDQAFLGQCHLQPSYVTWSGFKLAPPLPPPQEVAPPPPPVEQPPVSQPPVEQPPVTEQPPTEQPPTPQPPVPPLAPKVVAEHPEYHVENPVVLNGPQVIPPSVLQPATEVHIPQGPVYQAPRPVTIDAPAPRSTPSPTWNQGQQRHTELNPGGGSGSGSGSGGSGGSGGGSGEANTGSVGE